MISRQQPEGLESVTGCDVDTVGLNAEVTWEYVKFQEAKEKVTEQIDLFGK